MPASCCGHRVAATVAHGAPTSPTTGVRMHEPAAVPLRTAFVSDCHLGSKHCHAAELATSSNTCAANACTWSATSSTCGGCACRRARWGQAELRVIEALHALRRAGTEMIYIPGNHDRPDPARLRAGAAGDAGAAARDPRHRRRAPPAGHARRRLRRADAIRRPAGAVRRLAVLPHPHRQQLLNRARRRLGHALLVALGIPQAPQRRRRTLHRALRQAGLDDARRRGLDGIVCGHIHRAALEGATG